MCSAYICLCWHSPGAEIDSTRFGAEAFPSCRQEWHCLGLERSGQVGDEIVPSRMAACSRNVVPVRSMRMRLVDFCRFKLPWFWSSAIWNGAHTDYVGCGQLYKFFTISVTPKRPFHIFWNSTSLSKTFWPFLAYCTRIWALSFQTLSNVLS